MGEEYVDRSGDTEAFRAFVHAPELAAQGDAPVRDASRLPLIGAVVVAAVLLALATWIALG
ncbi:hypothetical protein [Micromonospora cathayae]|uniref:MYXO-CTERM domain-containing protein n=1 Tax=Micromonospora cathayae TaxID=3028804 RepID=A0ABY7ZQ18_9ACTN|nr:hypothetical protein [Micromonospora sp. HUAS 3]WDZ85100.1 hypothetical protein PVK37_01100 [Micromonospora sp. HUAS 3]